jgi:hypothetical protein
MGAQIARCLPASGLPLYRQFDIRREEEGIRLGERIRQGASEDMANGEPIIVLEERFDIS